MALEAITALNLEEAIVTRWNASTLDATILGRSADTADAVASALWKLEAPEDIRPREYVVFAVTSFVPESRDSGTDDTTIGSIVRATLRFNCYANDDLTAGRNARLVMNQFDNAGFPLVTVPAGNAAVILCQRTSDFADKVGDDEWSHTVMFDVLIDSGQQKV